MCRCARCARRRSEYAKGAYRLARIAWRGSQRRQTGGGVPEDERAIHRLAGKIACRLDGIPTGFACRRRNQSRKPDRCAQCRAQAEGFHGIRSHPRRARQDGRRAQRFKGRHHLGDRAMNSQALPKLALRPMLPADVPLLAEIFRAAIEELTIDDYSEAQQEAWASAADDEEEFGAKLSGALTLVATFGGAAVGFASLADNTRIDMLYVHPAAAGHGAAAMLCDALENLAAARGAKDLTVEASDTASGFFEKRGFSARTRNTVTLGGEWFANTTMIKPLVATESAP